MSLKILPWQSAEFLGKILKNSENDDSIEVKDLTTASAVGSGDNYGSDMLRVNVKYSRNKPGGEVLESISVIVKILPMVECSKKDLLEEFGVFQQEISMMTTTLTKMTEILNEEGCRLSPRVLYAEIGDPTFILMEDLATLGYRMADRHAGLDLEHSLLAMRNLAKFHASSVALSEKDASLSATYNKGLYRKETPIEFKQFFIGGIKNVAKECRNWTELGSNQNIFADKLEKLTEVFFERIIEVLDPTDSEFSVLNHGDYWLNNMLFRYDDGGKVKNHIFVDFQIPVWNTPAIDLLYFLNTTVSEEIELHHHEDLLKEYLNTLTTTMSKIGCKTRPPTPEGLNKILKHYELYSVVASCMVLPIVVLSKDEVLDFNDIGNAEESLSPAYKGKIFRKIMSRRLPEWNALGLLDL